MSNEKRINGLIVNQADKYRSMQGSQRSANKPVFIDHQAALKKTGGVDEMSDAARTTMGTFVSESNQLNGLTSTLESRNAMAKSLTVGTAPLLRGKSAQGFQSSSTLFKQPMALIRTTD